MELPGSVPATDAAPSMAPPPSRPVSSDDRPLKLNPTGTYSVIPKDLEAAEHAHRMQSSVPSLLSPLSLNAPIAASTLAVPKDAAKAIAAALVPCLICGRKFAPTRVDAHQRICTKAANGSKRRGVFVVPRAQAPPLVMAGEEFKEPKEEVNPIPTNQPHHPSTL